ncbi:MAG: S-layer homology domain-containing protein [Candidatus Gracilibacteria bacterium]|nr:S-layer homology domain-containing protein [Candidatus Gracilibacteria bacterium]
MLKRFISGFLISLGVLLVISTAHAQNQPFFYYLLPQDSSFTVNDKIISNEGFTGKMIYQQAAEEKVTINSKTAGIRVMTSGYSVDVKPNVSLTLNQYFNLDAGSVHIITDPKHTEEKTLFLNDLKLTFQSADFIAFISGDKKEKVIKVLQGEITVSHPETEQSTVIKQQQITSTDAEGRLLTPYPFDSEPDATFWWEDKTYQYEYERLPLAHAGGDQRVLGNIPVVLDGSKSDYETGDIFEWTLEKGPNDESGKEIKEVAFDSSNIVKPLFTPTVEGEFVFTLQITDQKGEKSNLDHVIVFVGKRYLRPITIFPDVPAEHPNNLAITYLYKKNVMQGSEDPESGKTLFRPNDTINRVEILKTVFENKKKAIPTEDELRDLKDDIFVDVKAEHWFAPYVYLGKKEGIIKGSNGLYRPADKVLLVEALKIVIQANQISLDSYIVEGEKPYTDAEIGAWYNPYLFFVKKYNLFDPDSKGNILPAQELTRAKFAEMLYRMESINLLEKRGFLSGKLTDNVLKETIEGADIYIYKALEEDDPEKEGASVFSKKGSLYHKVTTREDGTFNVSLPIHSKFYIEGVKEDAVTSNKIIIEVLEDKITKIELEMNIDEE